MWLSMNMKQEIKLSVLGKETVLPISDIVDGSIGCLLVFNTKEDAIEYSGNENDLVEVKEQ